MRFDIKPRSGMGDLRWGMSRADVAKLLGPALNEAVVEDAFELSYENCISISFCDDAVFQIAATRRNGNVFYDDLNIFGSDPLQILRRMEKDAGNAFECHGLIVFPALGVTLTGFHDGDGDQKAVTVYQEGMWRDLEEGFGPFAFRRNPPEIATNVLRPGRAGSRPTTFEQRRRRRDGSGSRSRLCRLLVKARLFRL